MNLPTIKTKRAQRGFTIVELLIVIVVIGILAAIVIVAYNGVTQQANAARAQANASSIQKTAEAFNAECPVTGPCTGLSGFPSLANLGTYNSNAAATAKYSTSLTVNSSTLTSAAADGSIIQYVPKGTTGACIGYWDAKAGSAKYLYAGNAVTGSNVAVPTCV